jgi:hypothetical protein
MQRGAGGARVHISPGGVEFLIRIFPHLSARVLLACIMRACGRAPKFTLLLRHTQRERGRCIFNRTPSPAKTSRPQKRAAHFLALDFTACGAQFAPCSLFTAAELFTRRERGNASLSHLHVLNFQHKLILKMLCEMRVSLILSYLIIFSVNFNKNCLVVPHNS